MAKTPTLEPLRFIARRLRVPVKWLRDEALAGRIPHLNAGGQILANPENVEAALAARVAGERAVAHEG